MISTHVLDTAHGRPASGLPVRLDRREGDAWHRVGEARTDHDGRVAELLPEGGPAGTYRLRFDLDSRDGFYPEVVVVFRVTDAAAHHHVPLLLSPFGYTTYRGT